MRSAGRLQWRMFAASLWVAQGLLLGACGGGSDDAAPEFSSTAVASESAVSNGRAFNLAHKRRARSYARKGVTAIAVATEGKSIGVADSDGRVRMLDGSGARELRVLKVQGGAVAAGLNFSADGRYLVMVGRDSAAQLWSAETGELVFTLRGHESALRSVAASADGSVIATGGEDTRVMVWDGATGRLKRVLRGHTDFVNALNLSADGRLLASGDGDARILVWSVETGQLLYTLRGHSDEVTAVAFSANGKLLASAGEDGKVLLWDMVIGHPAQTLEGHRAPVRSLAFSSDSGLLASGAVDGRVVVWDMATRNVSQDLAASSAAINAVAFGTSNGKQLFSGNEDGQVFSWNLLRATAR